jgi:molybdopterin/thiamine biosynthesis adenylyltransferase
MKNTRMDRFRIPRYMGLLSVHQSGKKNFELQFGFSKLNRREIKVDCAGLKLLECLTSPITEKELATQLGLTKASVRSSLRTLLDEGLVAKETSVPKKLKRYDRHLLFYGLQGADALEAQKAISKSRIALIGMGGIGSWVSMGLIGAGFRELRLIDFDSIELSNLTRQILYTEKDIGRLKAEVAGERLRERNSQTKISTVHLQLKGTAQLRRALKNIDFVIISADRPARIHDWVDEVCIGEGISYLNVGYRDGVGVVGPLTKPGETSCYQCHKPKDSKDSSNKALLGQPTRSQSECGSILTRFDERYQAPSFGPLNALVSSIAANEVIKYLARLGEVKSHGTELEIDPMTFEIMETPYPRDIKCWHCKPTRKARTK